MVSDRDDTTVGLFFGILFGILFGAMLGRCGANVQCGETCKPYAVAESGYGVCRCEVAP
jgi:hypothetical protein